MGLVVAVVVVAALLAALPGRAGPGGSRPGGSRPDGSRRGGSRPGGSRSGGSRPGGSRRGGARPGRPGGPVRLRAPWLLVAAVLAQLLAALLGQWALYAAGLAAAAALVLVFLRVNRGWAGGTLVALGLTANALVVALNGAMPVSLSAAVRAGADVGDVVLGADPLHEVATPATRLPWLGDVVPVPLPLRPEVVSAGDVLVAAGLGRLVLLAGTDRRRRARPVGADHVPPWT